MDSNVDRADLRSGDSTGKLPLRVITHEDEKYVLLDDMLNLIYDSINIPGVLPSSVEAFYGMADAICIITGKEGRGRPYANETNE
jgi:hypothetical protein